MPGRDLTFSHVLATIGRTDEIANFLLHFDAQTYRSFELIVVDQNPNDRLLPLLAGYDRRFFIRNCQSAPGLSRAHNMRLPCATGGIIAFPHDDCWYPPDLLKRAAARFAADPSLDGLTGLSIDKSFSRCHTTSGPIDKYNIFQRCSSYMIFLRRRLVESVGKFDETLGLGTHAGRIAAEESDYLIRALAAGRRLSFDANLQVFHQEPTVMYDPSFNLKARGNNRALGYVMRRPDYPWWYVARTWLRALGGMCASAVMLNLSKLRYLGNVLFGRIHGYFDRTWRFAPSRTCSQSLGVICDLMP